MNAGDREKPEYLIAWYITFGDREVPNKEGGDFLYPYVKAGDIPNGLDEHKYIRFEHAGAPMQTTQKGIELCNQ